MFMKSIKAIIFDFGRVLYDFDLMIACRKLAEFCSFSPERIHQLIFKEGLEKQYEEGGITSTNFHKAVVEKIQADEKLGYRLFGDIWSDIFDEIQGIESVLESIRPDIKILVLSNTSEIHWGRISRFPVIRKFFNDSERLILSYRMGFCKPDKRIWLEGIKRADCEPEEIIYIDDIADYASAAAELGINSVLYNCRNESVKNLQSALSAFGVLI